MTETALPQRSQGETSYKFQRLREKIRRAIESGELSGKLPGERALARRFHVNAKTLSKALTDLAAEGVLDRSIGRGTYVKGSEPPPVVSAGKWLVVCDAIEDHPGLITELKKACPELETVTEVDQLRPSFLNQFSAVINLAEATSESFLRQLLVRNMPVVNANHEPKAYSVHAVVPDTAMDVTRAARDLFLAGHRKLGAVEPQGSTLISHTLRQAAARYARDTVVEMADASQAAELVNGGITALLCGCCRDARLAKAALAARHISVPQQVSIVAVGCSGPDAECSGYFVDLEKIAQAAVNLLKDTAQRPVTLWIPGTWVDRGSIAPTGEAPLVEEAQPFRVSGVVV